MERITELKELREYLRLCQAQRRRTAAFRLEGAAARLSPLQLTQTLDQMLPWVQSSSRQLRRERGAAEVRCSLRYRDGVRLGDAWERGEAEALGARERQALARAQGMAQEARQAWQHPRDRLRHVTQLLAQGVVYDCPAHGRGDYGRVVSGVWALTEGRANCQGFTDAMYLLGTLLGIPMGFQAGWNPRGPHLWNLCLVEGCWYALDATAAASGGVGEDVCLGPQDCRAKGLRWPDWGGARAASEGENVGISPLNCEKAPFFLGRNMV